MKAKRWLTISLIGIGGCSPLTEVRMNHGIDNLWRRGAVSGDVHDILSYGIIWRAAANVEHQMKTTYDGTTIHETSYESVAASSQSKMVHLGVYPVTPTQGPHTIEQYLSKESAGVSAANLAESAIAVIGLKDDVTTYPMGGNIYSGRING